MDDDTDQTSVKRPVKDASDRVTRYMDAGVLGDVMKAIEWAVAAILVVLAAWGTFGLAAALAVSIWQHALSQNAEIYIQLIDATLIIFIVVELFRIAVAYIRHEDVVPTVMEAALVAVARKVLIIEPTIAPQELLFKSLGLGVLILTIGITWYLLRRTGAGFTRDEGLVIAKAKGIDPATLLDPSATQTEDAG
jgi:uncharacterized membrane protein (DUF373 family)